jgi:hypothetical protein
MEICMAEGKQLEETILTIVIPCPDFWHRVYQNNYCNSVYGTLLNIKVRVCGKTVTNKGLPTSVKEDIQRIKKGGKSFIARKMSCRLSKNTKGGDKELHNLCLKP